MDPTDYDEEDRALIAKLNDSEKQGRSKRHTRTGNFLGNLIRSSLQCCFHFPGRSLSTEQIHVWAVLLGIIGGTVAFVYSKILQYLILLIWTIIPNALHSAGVFHAVPSWLYIWFMPPCMAVLIGLLLWKLPPCGNLPMLFDGIHNKGELSSKYILPMWIISTLSISAGGSAGPEASMLIIMAGISSKITSYLKQPLKITRILSLCAMSAGLSAFFSLPLGGALFVLEVPHRMGLQYYEAIAPAMLASLIAVVVNKFEAQENFESLYEFPPLTENLTAYHFWVGAIVGVVAAALAALFTFYVRNLKKLVYKTKLAKRPLLLSVIGGFFIGLIGAIYPATMFWSEGEMPTILDRGNTPLKHLARSLNSGMVPMTTPYSIFNCFWIGVTKMLAIGITIACGWPGGIIFPLFYAGAALGWAVEWVPNGPPVSLILSCLMVALEACITRTPWASSIVILLLQRLPQTAPNHILQVFGPVTISVYVAIFLTRKYRFYSSDIQRGRKDVILLQKLDDKEPADDEVTDAMKIEKQKDLPDLCGYLEKKGSLGLVHLWRKRWFVKRDNAVFYYTEKMPNHITKLHKDLTLHLGSIDLREVTNVRALPEMDDRTFAVSVTSREYYLRAANAEEKEKWMNAFQTTNETKVLVDLE